jgi:hypothetical protein
MVGSGGWAVSLGEAVETGLAPVTGFLQASWDASVVCDDVDFNARTLTYDVRSTWESRAGEASREN